MPDPISGPVEFAFVVLALIIMSWVAADPRRIFAFLNAYRQANVPSDAVFKSVRIIAGFCAAGAAVLLLGHLLRAR